MRAQSMNHNALLAKRAPQRSAKSVLGRISSIYLLTLFATIATLLMFWVEFLFPNFHTGLTRSFVYYTLLTVYVVYKEIYRWSGQHKEKRIGHVWVLVWWSSTFLMEGIGFLTKEALTPLPEQYLLTIAVSVSFLASRFSKCLYERQKARR